MRLKPNKLYKDSKKQEVGSSKRSTTIYKSFASMTKRRREKTQINKIRNEKGDITTNTNKIQRLIREDFENLWSSKLGNLDENG
jgi:ribosomal protein L20A (L18A)